jgi:hypothetical protein
VTPVSPSSAPSFPSTTTIRAIETMTNSILQSNAQILEAMKLQTATSHQVSSTPSFPWVEIGKGIAAAVAAFLGASISFPSATPAAVSTATVTPTNPAPAVSPPVSPQPYVAHTSNEVLVRLNTIESNLSTLTQFTSRQGETLSVLFNVLHTLSTTFIFSEATISSDKINKDKSLIL